MHKNSLFIIYGFLLNHSSRFLGNINNLNENGFNNSKNINNYIYNDLNSNKRLNNIINLKKLVYTIILGNYDKPKPFNKQKGYDYYLITDDTSFEKYKNTNWTILEIPEIVKCLNISIVKKQRFLKLHPHLFFKKYDLSIYIDGTFIIKGDLNEFLLRIITPKFFFYTFEHPRRRKIFLEIKSVIKAKKEKKSLGNVIKEKYEKEKFPDNNGLIESCLLIRKHNDKQCIDIMTKWYNEIKNYSHRDQLSFNYIIWKNHIKIKYIPKRYAYQYFLQKSSHLIHKIYIDKEK
jgi:hypothetical protein